MLIFGVVLLVTSMQLLAQDNCHEFVGRKIFGAQFDKEPEKIRERALSWLETYFPDGFQGGAEEESIWVRLKLEPELYEEPEFMFSAVRILVTLPSNLHNSYIDEIIFDNSELKPEFIWGDGGAIYSATDWKHHEYVERMKDSFPPTLDQARAFNHFCDCYEELHPSRINPLDYYISHP